MQKDSLLTNKVYDAIIIGSGASGGMAAKELTARGLEILLLEAGPPVELRRDFAMNVVSYGLMYYGLGSPSWKEREQWMQDTANEFNRQFYIKDSEHPYTTDPGMPFMWVRARIVGGKTLHWGRLCWRFSNLDFKAASHDGFDVDWPIEYKDLCSYYDKAEERIGVCGNIDGLWWLPDGNYLPLPALTDSELSLKTGAEKLGLKLIQARVASLAPLMPRYTRQSYAGVRFNPLSSMLIEAESTGRLTLRPNAIVRHITVDTNTGKANGVAVVDRLTYQELEFSGKVIIVAASTLESTRILLNSKSRQHPNGLGNSSGVLGHYLVDHFGGVGAYGILTGPAGRGTASEDNNSPNIYVPRFRNLDKATEHPKFIRGYGFEGNFAFDRFTGLERQLEGSSAKFKKQMPRRDATLVGLTTRANMLSRFENFVEIDPDGVVDAWGIPALKIHIQHSDNEREMGKDAAEMAEVILRNAGAQGIIISRQMTVPGRVIHELGTARMGNDPKESVLNKFNQMHDVKNVFVTDGAAFVGAANQNPTLTIFALTIRACEYLVEELRQGNL